MTVLLTAPPGIITQRIRGRNATDPDLTKVLDNQERLRKMRYFLQKYRIPSMEIDTSNCTPKTDCSANHSWNKKNGHDNIYAKRSLAIRDLFALYYNKEGVKVEKLIWNVYRCRNGHIQVYNIFQHGKFSDEVKAALTPMQNQERIFRRTKESNTLLLQSQKRMGGYY